MMGKRTQAPDDIDQLQHQIDNTREELADTVEALASRPTSRPAPLRRPITSGSGRPGGWSP
jgi:hypothetical protein